MELDKRVDEIETELKIMKGEIKKLLIDIRDLVNKNENPFCNIPCPGALKSTVSAKSEIESRQPALVENEEAEYRHCAEVSDRENQALKISVDSFRKRFPEQENSMQSAHKQEMHVPEPESSRRIDTFMLVQLMRWADYAVKTVGHENLEELLNIYTLTGHFPEETKRIIENMANLSIEEPAEVDRVSMKDNITVLSQLNAILNPESFRKNIQPFYETSEGLRDKEKKKKTGVVSVEFKSQKAEKLKRTGYNKSDTKRRV